MQYGSSKLNDDDDDDDMMKYNNNSASKESKYTERHQCIRINRIHKGKRTC